MIKKLAVFFQIGDTGKMPKKWILTLGGLGVVIVLFFAFVSTASSQTDNTLRMYFCDVGQGDGIYIRFPDGEDMVIDGGPNKQILECLGKYMPFYDREIDVVVATHPQKDHIQGLIEVLDRYTVTYVVMGAEGNNSLGYTQLVDVIRRKNITVKNLYRGDSLSMGEARIDVLWPTRDYVSEHVTMNQCSDEMVQECDALAKEQLSKGAVLGLSTDEDLNNFSFYMHVRYGDFDALFTGDGDTQIQPSMISIGNLPDVDLLKFPHHGSRTGISAEFLDLVKPEMAIISVGKNGYGHPTDEALGLLQERSIRTFRTDLMGDVLVETDGKSWVVE